MVESELSTLYTELKKAAKADITSSFLTARLIALAQASHDLLFKNAEIVELKSLVPHKKYIAYQSDGRLSRPINKSLFVFNQQEFRKRLTDFGTRDWRSADAETITRTIYTLAMAFCAAIDIAKTGDKKTPATYFEIAIGHIIAAHLGVAPTNSIQVLSGDLKGDLPTDLIFDLGSKRTKFHVPIKLSTRERVIQVWAHQRVVDGIYGVGRYKGILVSLTETKLDSRSLEVVEICLPDQWRVYQMYIARLERVYYLDVPTKYAALAESYPTIEVKPFGYFFQESGGF